jgi:hypothetical protein
MPNKPKSAAIWNPFTAKSRADRSAQEMYPGKIGQDDQRDAARHMLASGYLAKAWSPGVADLIGKAHEFKETPFRHLGALAGVAQHRYDRPIDLHNNTLGIELAQKAGSMEEFERLVNEAAERARPTQTPGTPWVPSAKDAAEMRKGSAQYQAGGLVKGGLKTLDNLVMKATKGRTAAKDVFASDFQTIPEKELMRMNSIEREQRVPMQSIVPTQPDVKTETALEYMMSNRVRDPGTKKMPEVVKWGDKYYIMDGHHRVAGQLALDKTDIPVQVIGEVPALKKADGGLVAAFKDGGSVAAFQDGGAAFGVFPQMKPRRTRQDPEAAKSVPLALARGAVAGALGAPGDIESLVRMLPGLDESTTFLPTSEDIERRLPMPELAATPVGKAATNVGALAGGFYTGPGAPLRLAASVPGALKHGATEFVKAAGQPGVNVVKPEGGDWLKGAVQRGVSGLKKYDLPDLFPELGGGPPPNTPANEAINKWIGSNLGNYLQKQMATPSDPVRKLAEEGITHIPDLANRTASFPTGALQERRATAGFPEYGMGQSELAKKWENLADESIYTHRAGDIQKTVESGGKLDEAKAEYVAKMAEIDAKMAERLASRGFNEDETATMLIGMSPRQKAEIVGDNEFNAVRRNYEMASIDAQSINAKIAEENPWIAKLDPEAPAYHGDVYDLGFDHVVDVLGDMVASGRIRPEQLNKVSLEQAIRMTHQYDIEMAEKAAKATAVAREGLPVYKEYPEGYKWVELNKPGAFAAESEAMGHSVRGYEPPKGHPDWTGGSGDAGHSGYGHGGWEAIKSGRAKVYSLVDEKGKPHVTVEVKSGRKLTEADLPNDVRDDLAEAYGDASREEFEAAVQRALEAREIPQQITQIKGKSNRAPKEEYLPFVQDFVKSGQWGDVGDLRNTGLVDTKQPFAYQDVPSDLWKVQEKLGEDSSRYMTQDELKGLLDSPKGYNKGGTVKTGIKEGVDLARRSLFGLRPSQDMAGRELVPVQRDLDRMQAELAKAPKVEQKTTTVQPSPTAPKIEQTVKSIAETPVSRRTVLKTAAGQVMQNALPASSFADLMKPATVAKQAVQAVAPAAAVTASSVPALMAKAVKMGMDSDEALAFVKRELGESAETVMAKQDPELLYDTLKDPFESIVDDPEWLYKFKNGKQDRLMGPGELLQVQLGQGETPGSLKETLRGLKAEMSPEDYANMKNAMKDAINQEIKYGGDY